MRICVVSGSHRVKSNTIKCANYIAHVLKEKEHQVTIINLQSMPVDSWTENFWRADSQEASHWQVLAKDLIAADALVILTPEYAGMATPNIKNFLLKCSGKETGNKPALLVGVSSGNGGASPLQELKLTGFKNNFICVIPYSVVIRQANKLFQKYHISQSEEETKLRATIEYAIDHLIAYGSALSKVRELGITDFKIHPYGQI